MSSSEQALVRWRHAGGRQGVPVVMTRGGMRRWWQAKRTDRHDKRGHEKMVA